MSHIDNALKKAQEEKDILHKRYNRITPVTSHKSHTGRMTAWTIIVAVVLISVAVIALFLFGNRAPDGKDSAITRKTVVVEETPAPQQEPVNRTDTKAVPLPGTSKKRSVPSPTAEDTDGVKKSTDMTVRVDTMYRAALSYQRKGSLDMAGKTYENVLHIEPEHVFTLNNLGVIYMSRGRTQNAEEMFKRAISLRSDYVNPYYNLACLYSQEGDIPHSLEYLKMAVQLNNDVRKWAKDDRDLKNVRESEEFGKVFE